MISKETKNRSIRLVFAASILFFIGSFSTKYLADEYLSWPTLIFGITIFFLSGSFLVASFLSILDDRKDFIEIVKKDFKHIYESNKIRKKYRKS